MRDVASSENPVRSYGTKLQNCFAQFAGAASTTPTLVHALGVSSVTQSGTTTGVYTVNLVDKFGAMMPRVEVLGDKTRVHDVTIDSIGTSSFTFTHFVSSSDRTATASTASNGASPAVSFIIKVEGWAQL